MDNVEKRIAEALQKDSWGRKRAEHMAPVIKHLIEAAFLQGIAARTDHRFGHQRSLVNWDALLVSSPLEERVK